MNKILKKLSILLILLAVFMPMQIFAQGMGEQSAFLEGIQKFWQSTGFANFEFKYLAMIIVGTIFIILAITKGWEPLLLIPIGFGMIIGNIPFNPLGESVGIYQEGSVMNFYTVVLSTVGILLSFLGIEP